MKNVGRNETFSCTQVECLAYKAHIDEAQRSIEKLHLLLKESGTQSELK